MPRRVKSLGLRQAAMSSDVWMNDGDSAAELCCDVIMRLSYNVPMSSYITQHRTTLSTPILSAIIIIISALLCCAVFLMYIRTSIQFSDHPASYTGLKSSCHRSVNSARMRTSPLCCYRVAPPTASDNILMTSSGGCVCPAVK